MSQGLDQVQGSAKSTPWLFNREVEVKHLDDLLQKTPRAIKVILGPRNSGKSTILASWIQRRSQVVYVDFREIDSSTPAAFVAALLAQLLEKTPRGLLPEVEAAFNIAHAVASGEQASAGFDSTSLKFDIAKAMVSFGSKAANGTLDPLYMTAIYKTLGYAPTLHFCGCSA
jgi:GTPase SAR1 family protein